MVNLFRQFQRPLMIVTTVVMIIAFVVLYNGTQFDHAGPQRSYSIYGTKLSQLDIDKTVRRFQVAQALGVNELLYGLVGQAFSREQAADNFVWNSLVLDHEARKLGVMATPDEIVAVFTQLPAFQTNGKFDNDKYSKFLMEVLSPNGFTDAQIEELVRDDIRLRKLTALIGSTVDASPAEFARLYTQNNQKTDVSLVRLPLAEFSAAVAPTEEEIAKYYEEHKAKLMTEERRVVSFVKVDLTDDEKKLTGKERVAALQRVSDKTRDFGQALLEPGATFAGAAAQMGLTVQTTGEFPPSKAPAAFGEGQAAQEALREAFGLAESTPGSNPIASENGFLVLHLDKVIPKEQLTLEQATPKIVDAIKAEKGRNALTTRANELHTRLADALKEGKTFAEATAANDVVMKSFPPFSLSEPVNEPHASEIITKAVELPVGGLSGVVSTPDEAILVYVNSRQPVDEAKMRQEEEQQIGHLRQFKRQAAFSEWLATKRKEANPHSIAPRSNAASEGQDEHEG